ncbi:bifunctional phosphopantothenoylcysteine decarboxylase/phosphopantothenate--cysteine ligase CoaBC [Actinomyces minihominis]|uniref:bifunctional phosphopantothenoylcysteine decarboxylase/phosphopantothenate--cysteine ligase CoaBC n=1 Tax=Actinomyces minihominis TaxID=2002838 RepID=UPI000C075A08|nr:bifunctional phosphopantothenoylcysteine decarboxylase/phosphopantothenate--cysteine ligase CoaBC [Actinomyces minihominis]
MEATTSSRATPTVVIGIGGGIAAYKVAFVVRDFRRAGWKVHVIPTESALNFVGANTWSELSENPVTTSVFSAVGPGHIELARRADLIVIAPTTANLLAKIRSGIADDLLTTVVAASAAPVLLAPAMHTQMWLNPATQENVQVLRDRDFTVLDPATGELSSGDTGPGRLPDPAVITEAALALWNHHQQRSEEGALTGRRVVITAGGTEEALDPVRFLTNRSSGYQGVALAQAALDLGAEVVLIRAAMTAPLPTGKRLTVIEARSAGDMATAVHRAVEDADVLVMAAAVADFTPSQFSSSKIKKTGDSDTLTLQLSRTEDILAAVARSANRPAALVGFGAETGSKAEVLEFGAVKARAKKADLLAVNQVGEGIGFGDVPNTLLFFDSDGILTGETSGSKDQVAADLLSRVIDILKEKD